MSYVKNFLKMDKIGLLLDAIEHPERYSDPEIESMLQDPEVREIYDMLGQTKSSLRSISSPDINAEWQDFELAHRINRFRILNLFSRNVAASIAIGIAVAAVAAAVGASINYAVSHKADVQADDMAVSDIVAKTDGTTSAVDVIHLDVAPEIIVFDNEPFEAIINRIAEYYGYKVEFTTDKAKSLRLYFRWDQTLEIEDVVGSLNNFEQIHMIIKDITIKIE